VLRRPSRRNRSGGSELVELNLVPMMDAFVTLIGFLLYTMAFLSFVATDSPVPTSSPTELAEKLKTEPLQLTLSINKSETLVWSAFKKIPSTSIPHLPDGSPDTKLIHEKLIEIKAQFPQEEQIVFAPSSATSYDSLVRLFDAAKILDPTDPPIFKAGSSGVEEPITYLFPQITFGNLLSSEDDS